MLAKIVDFVKSNIIIHFVMLSTFSSYRALIHVRLGLELWRPFMGSGFRADRLCLLSEVVDELLIRNRLKSL